MRQAFSLYSKTFRPHWDMQRLNNNLSLNVCSRSEISLLVENHRPNTCKSLRYLCFPRYLAQLLNSNLLLHAIVHVYTFKCVFIYLGFYVAFNTVQVISQRVVGRAEETSTYSLLGFCTVNCRPTACNYQLSHLRLCGDRTPASEVGGESVTTLPPWPPCKCVTNIVGKCQCSLVVG